ncbi:MAG TPA: hypothetical protein VN753_15790 [Terracidiphilus sp.]|nr:hypothetical protein [Terracidiphilus sp.]
MEICADFISGVRDVLGAGGLKPAFSQKRTAIGPAEAVPFLQSVEIRVLVPV